MGKSSRDKGNRAERDLVKFLKEKGWEALRVPLSGAAAGFKGDLHVVTPNGVRLVLELKARRDEYNQIYAVIGDYAAFYETAEQCVMASLNVNDVLSGERSYNQTALTPTHRKLLRMRDLLQGADILVLKGDRKPFMFVRYE